MLSDEIKLNHISRINGIMLWDGGGSEKREDAKVLVHVQRASGTNLDPVDRLRSSSYHHHRGLNTSTHEPTSPTLTFFRPLRCDR